LLSGLRRRLGGLSRRLWRLADLLRRTLLRILLAAGSAGRGPAGCGPAPWRSYSDTGATALLQPQVVNEEPLVIMVFVVKFLDGLAFVDTGDADYLSAANRLSGADVRGLKRSQLSGAARLWLRTT
jgi:hypothetical protein